MENINLEIAFILDESGSMTSLREETIKGYNKILEEQKGKEGKGVVTTVTFNDRSLIIHDGIDIENVSYLTEKEYRPNGCTALFDAIGGTIEKISSRNKENKPSKTMVVIITDGMENASIEYSQKAIKALISSKEEQGWEFLFVGANIDSVQAADDIGIKEENAVNYHADKKGLETMYCCLSKSVSKMRSSGAIDKNWKRKIDDDFKSRNK